MKFIKYLLLFSLVSFAFSNCKKNEMSRSFLGKSFAQAELKSALDNNVEQNLIDNKKLIVRNSLTAIAIAEPILFGLNDRENIEKQKPYEIFLIDNHWILSGTLPTNKDGGTFLIIIDARNSKVIKITHGK